MKKIDETGDVAGKEHSGQYESAPTEKNIKLVEEITFSQGNKPETLFTPAEIAHELTIDRRSASCIIDQSRYLLLLFLLLGEHKVQNLTDSNNENQMICSKKLPSKYTQKTF